MVKPLNVRPNKLKTDAEPEARTAPGRDAGKVTTTEPEAPPVTYAIPSSTYVVPPTLSTTVGAQITLGEADGAGTERVALRVAPTRETEAVPEGERLRVGEAELEKRGRVGEAVADSEGGTALRDADWVGVRAREGERLPDAVRDGMTRLGLRVLVRVAAGVRDTGD
jgi:hypothetical protein